MQIEFESIRRTNFENVSFAKFKYISRNYGEYFIYISRQMKAEWKDWEILQQFWWVNLNCIAMELFHSFVIKTFTIEEDSFILNFTWMREFSIYLWRTYHTAIFIILLKKFNIYLDMNEL